jgi:E3 ubiquitin-protein ligase makorin
MAFIANHSKGQVPCKFYASGACRLGSNCKFSHNVNNLAPNNKSTTVCKFYLLGSCKAGNKCMFSHKDHVGGSKRSSGSGKAWLNINKLGRKILDANNNDNIVTHFAVNNNNSTTINKTNSQNIIEEMEDEDGVYFYGSDFTSSKEFTGPKQPPALNYSGIVERERKELVAKGIYNNNPRLPVEQQLCPFFKQGYCRFGDKCKLSHGNNRGTKDMGVVNHDAKEEDEMAEESLIQDEVNKSKNIECGICACKILEEKKDRFGLLVSCNHSFCLSCLRTWRENEALKFDKEAVRKCPICRLKSDFIIPSNRLITSHARKRELLMKYLTNLRNKKCKYYPDCPFGTSCFYAHIGPDGKLVRYELPRLKVDSNGNMKNISMPKLSELLENVVF